MLKEEANYWWETKRAMEGVTIVPWKRFIDLFLEKYFPKHLERQMELKFLELKQGNMSVPEYETKFTELSRFAPHQVLTDDQRALRFQQGLRPWIQNRIAMLELTSYATVVQKATIVEKGSELYDHERNNKRRNPSQDRREGKRSNNSNTRKQMVV